MPAEIKITKRAIDRLETDGTDRFYWDRELPGFGVRVRASGRKFFVAQYRTKGPVAPHDPRTRHGLRAGRGAPARHGPALRGQGRR